MNIVKICFQALKNFPATFESITYEDFMHAYALGKLLRFKPFTCSNRSELFASIVLNYNFWIKLGNGGVGMLYALGLGVPRKL